MKRQHTEYEDKTCNVKYEYLVDVTEK